MGYGLLLLVALGAGWLLLRDGENTSEPESIVPQEPMVVEGDHVWLLGDSHGVGLQRSLRQLAEAKGVQLETEVEVGQRTRWGLKQAIQRGAGDDLWLVCLGTNDAAGITSSLQSDVQGILSEARRRGVVTVWLIPPDGGVLDGFDEMVKIVTGESPLVIHPPKGLPMAPDKVHLTPNGYQMWAQDVWNKLT